ncbi:MAG: NYN domain-containing protein [Candidatus Subteraquimicrobiales bacterium]|nr:NYN domain-containing protein [Candidatus Subteraquimicrobiales bacterium]
MNELLIIDGYNVISALSRYKGLKKLSLEAARAKLIEDLVNFKAATDYEVIVVFDSPKQSSIRKENFHGVKVIFSGKGKTADSIIERIIAENEERERIVLVTLDYTEQRLAFGKGVIRKTPKELKADLFEQQEYVKENRKHPKSFLEDRLSEEIKKKLSRLIKE